MAKCFISRLDIKRFRTLEFHELIGYSLIIRNVKNEAQGHISSTFPDLCSLYGITNIGANIQYVIK